MKTNWESLIENHYNKDEKLNMNSLVRLVEQVMNSPIELQEESAVGDVGKKKVVRFSEVISIPRLTPSEAWGYLEVLQGVKISKNDSKVSINFLILKQLKTKDLRV